MFTTYRERFDVLKLSECFEFISFKDHKIELKCKKCGWSFSKWDDFVRRSKRGKIICPLCRASCRYEAPEYEKRTPKVYEKKGYHTPEAEAARARSRETRIRTTDEKYRRLFYDLGIKEFDYIGYYGNHKVQVRCNRCGTALIRGVDVFRGKANTFRCDICGNGMKAFSQLANEALAFYADGHSQKETIAKFGISEYELQGWAKRRGVSNGRTFEQAGRECNRLRHEGVLPMPINANQKRIEYARIRWSERLSEFGFELIEYKNKKLTFKCLTCGGLIERGTQSGLFKRGVSCPICRQKERKLEQEKAQAEKANREAERNAMREAKKAANPLGLSAYQLEREKILDLPHSCKVCGAEYTIRAYMESIGTKYKRDSGFCSKECREAHKKQKEREHSRDRGSHSDNHYSRAKKLGLPVERGVTLKKLYIRDGGICKICGMACLYSGDPVSDLYPSIDHVIPLSKDEDKIGGHTWSNVQLAHRICNSVKSAKRGEEWHNGTKKAS